MRFHLTSFAIVAALVLHASETSATEYYRSSSPNVELVRRTPLSGVLIGATIAEDDSISILSTSSGQKRSNADADKLVERTPLVPVPQIIGVSALNNADVEILSSNAPDSSDDGGDDSKKKRAVRAAFYKRDDDNLVGRSPLLPVPQIIGVDLLNNADVEILSSNAPDSDDSKKKRSGPAAFYKRGDEADKLVERTPLVPLPQLIGVSALNNADVEILSSNAPDSSDDGDSDDSKKKRDAPAVIYKRHEKQASTATIHRRHHAKMAATK